MARGFGARVDAPGPEFPAAVEEVDHFPSNLEAAEAASAFAACLKVEVYPTT
jgi:hypothetical protein